MQDNASTRTASATAAPAKVTAHQIVEQMLERLVAVVSQEAKLTAALLALAQETQTRLLVDDCVALLETSQQQGALAQELRQAEHQRLMITQRLTPFVPGLDKLRLSEWADRIPDPYASRLSELCDDFRRATDQLRALNRQNMVLIHRSLRYADMALGIEASTYGSRSESVHDLPQLVDTTL
jgi:flagellar biosynthesis/type III secretory pathway chaperone